MILDLDKESLEIMEGLYSGVGRHMCLLGMCSEMRLLIGTTLSADRLHRWSFIISNRGVEYSSFIEEHRIEVSP